MINSNSHAANRDFITFTCKLLDIWICYSVQNQSLQCFDIVSWGTARSPGLSRSDISNPKKTFSGLSLTWRLLQVRPGRFPIKVSWSDLWKIGQSNKSLKTAAVVVVVVVVVITGKSTSVSRDYASLVFQQAVHVATQYAPTPLLPCGRPSASRAAEQTQRSSTFPRRIRSHADCCSRLVH